jgi:hypothetical protein
LRDVGDPRRAEVRALAEANPGHRSQAGSAPGRAQRPAQPAGAMRWSRGLARMSHHRGARRR